MEKVSKALDTGKYVVGVFLDLKKAFDTIDHTILLEKLTAMELEETYTTGSRAILPIEVNMLNIITLNRIQCS